MTIDELILEAQKLNLMQQIKLVATLIKSISQRLLKPSPAALADSPQSILDRMGGLPQNLLAQGNLSDRDDRRAAIQAYLKDKQCQRLS